MAKHDELLRTVRGLAVVAPDTKTLMQRIADHLHSVMPRFNSISFRLIDPADPGMLILGLKTGGFIHHFGLLLGRVLAGSAPPLIRTRLSTNGPEMTSTSRHSLR